MTEPAGSAYLSISAASLLRYQPERSILAPVVLRSSIQSPASPALCARISLITTAGGLRLAASSIPGVPRTARLARQLDADPHVLAAAFGSINTSVSPSPSVEGCQI